MLNADYLPEARRSLATLLLDEDLLPLLDLDDAHTLAALGVRPSEVVIHNRPRTQAIARQVYERGGYAGLSWWSTHRPQWLLHALWDHTGVEVHDVEPIAGHAALIDAARRLHKHVDPALGFVPAEHAPQPLRPPGARVRSARTVPSGARRNRDT